MSARVTVCLCYVFSVMCYVFSHTPSGVAGLLEHSLYMAQAMLLLPVAHQDTAGGGFPDIKTSSIGSPYPDLHTGEIILSVIPYL